MSQAQREDIYNTHTHFPVTTFRRLAPTIYMISISVHCFMPVRVTKNHWKLQTHPLNSHGTFCPPHKADMAVSSPWVDLDMIIACYCRHLKLLI